MMLSAVGSDSLNLPCLYDLSLKKRGGEWRSKESADRSKAALADKGLNFQICYYGKCADGI